MFLAIEDIPDEQLVAELKRRKPKVNQVTRTTLCSKLRFVSYEAIVTADTAKDLIMALSNVWYGDPVQHTIREGGPIRSRPVTMKDFSEYLPHELDEGIGEYFFGDGWTATEDYPPEERW